MQVGIYWPFISAILLLGYTDSINELIILQKFGGHREGHLVRKVSMHLKESH